MIDMTLGKNSHKITLKPFSFFSYSLVTTTYVFIGLLLCQVAMLFVTQSYNALVNVFTSVFSSVLVEMIFYYINRNNFMYRESWKTCIIHGLIVGLMTPASYSAMALFFVSFFVLMIGRYVIGSFYNSWVNLSALTICVLYFLNPEAFPAIAITSQELQSRNSALYLIRSGAVDINAYDSAITEFLNNHIFSFFSVSIPDGYVSLFWDNGFDIPAFRFNFITLISSIVIFSLELVDYIIPVCFITVYLVLVRIFASYLSGGPAFQGDVLLALLTGGTLFSTLYILQWFGTTPVTRSGKIYYGIISGIIGFLIIGFGLSPAGFVFMVLAMNLISIVIQVLENKKVDMHVERNLIERLRSQKDDLK